MAITFRQLTTMEELALLPEMEASVWVGDTPIPLQLTVTLAKFGGIFLGAFDEEKIVGFVYSFPGFTDGQPHLCSHMMGFLPEYRKKGLGVQLKWLQREEALRRQYTKITWTYDPLESVNGYLNISKLGGIVRTYLPNCYGVMEDVLNRGLPSDRFLVEWFIDSNRVQSYYEGKRYFAETADAPSVLFFELDGKLPRPAELVLDREEPVLLLPVPAHFQEVKRADMNTALCWREKTGQLFQHYFSRGYMVTGLLRPNGEVARYILERQPLETVLKRM
jgi:predicted GNAT superfamily acetyltransferase